MPVMLLSFIVDSRARQFLALILENTEYQSSLVSHPLTRILL